MKKGKIRVLMMVSWYSPAEEGMKIGVFHNEQARALQQYCDVAIYCPYDRVITECCTKSVDWGVLTYRSRYHIQKKMRNRRYMFRAMRRIKREFNPDIIHAHVATEAGRFAIVLGKLFHIPVMITEHSAPEGSEVDRFPHFYYAKFAYGHSRYNACVSDYLTEYLRKLFPKYQFETIYNGIEDCGCPAAKERGTREIPSCTMVANFYHKDIKGFHILIPVLARLKKEKKPILMQFVGDGEYLAYYKGEAERLGVADQCIFYGHCDRNEVNRILSESDFLVSASLFESFGCSIAEALMAGLPVVATACGGPNSLINKDNGILVEKGSEEALYDGISKMLKSYGKYDNKKIKKQAEERFSMRVVTEKYVDIYKRILREQKKR